MATLGGKVNYNEVSNPNELIPAGFYQAIIISSGGDPAKPETCQDGLVQSKSGKGRYLPMTFEIIEGEHKGRQLFKNFNLENMNETAVRIAQQEVKELLLAVGWDLIAKPTGPDDTSELHMIPITIQVKVSIPKNGDDPQNDVSHFKPRQNGIYQAAPKTAAPAAPPAAAPWMRNNTTAAK